MTCNYSRIKVLVACFVLAFLLAGSFYYISLPLITKKGLGAAGVVLFGLCLYQAILSLFKKGPGLVVDEKGIEDFQWGWGVIPWSDIVCVSVRTLKNTRFLSIETQNPMNYLSRVKGLTRFWIYSNELLGFPQICSNFNILTPGVDEVFDYIKAKYPDKAKT